MVTLIIALGVLLTSVALGNLIWFAMIGEINRKRDDAHQISYFGSTPLKFAAVVEQYRALYPKGRYSSYLLLCTVVTVGAVITAAIAAGFLQQ
jgi:hypothetical protein